jgi:hypothetical protein
MTFWFTIPLLLAQTAVPSRTDAGRPFQLAPGDFRWVPLTVRQTPVQVDCHFDVAAGNPSVHVELLPMSEFREFDRGRDHETLAATPEGRDGAFRRLIDVPGQYAVVIENARGAPPATVSLHIETSVNPNRADISRGLSPQRRLAVIAISLAFFFITVAWSGRKLLRAMRSI